MAALGASVTAVGPTGSGKSELLHRLYTSRAPRVITLEVVNETMRRDPRARRVFGRDETTDALQELARVSRWHLVTSLDVDETEWLFRVLVPELRSASTVSYATAVGGLVVSCGELLNVAPNGLGKSSPVKAAYLRGRHWLLSVHGATQHAPDCDPVTRMQADRVVFMRATDDLGLGAVQRATSSHIARVVAELPDFHSATCIRREGKAYIADDRDTVYRVLNFRGDSLSERSGFDAPALSAGAPVSASRNGHGRSLTGGNRSG